MARRWLLWFVCWTIVALYFTGQTLVLSSFYGDNLPPLRVFRVYATCAYMWLLFTPLIVRLAGRAPIVTPHIARSLAVHVLASLAFAVITLGMFDIVEARWPAFPMRRSFAQSLVQGLHVELLRYWVVVGLAHLVRYYRQLRERELATTQLRAELAEARLEVLRRQLHPHFLFNTLNSISVLMFEDPNVANRMLIRLSELLRGGLTDDAPHEVSLERELSFLERYLDIERMRFGDRLTIEVAADPSTLGARVPNLILQPIVENAIRYGVAAVDRPAKVSIAAEKVGGELLLHVRDDGPGFNGNVRRGVGLSNTEARLKQLYGSEQRLVLTSPPGGGVRVAISIPFVSAS